MAPGLVKFMMPVSLRLAISKEYTSSSGSTVMELGMLITLSYLWGGVAGAKGGSAQVGRFVAEAIPGIRKKADTQAARADPGRLVATAARAQFPAPCSQSRRSINRQQGSVSHDDMAQGLT